MFNVLIDTCVWLDMAHDAKQAPLLLVIENMLRQKMLHLIVPRVVIDEFKRNRARVAQVSTRSLKGHIAQVKDAINRIDGNARRKKTLLAHLDDLNHRAPLVGGAAETTLTRVEQLLAQAGIVEASNAAKLKAAERGLQKLAPCHHDNKNAMADALLLETYFEVVKAGTRGERFAFVSHNRSEFSLPNGNQNVPHPDIADGFSRVKSLYFINLAACLRRIDPSMVSELVWEQSWDMEPRGLSDLLKAEDLLFHQVWFNRHINLRWRIERGKVKVVDDVAWDKRGRNNSKYIIDSVWEGAQHAAARTLRKYGKENFGPWDDFEWGMINGKLSAIRWMLGSEWDMLDT
jgi:PIN domain